MFVPSMMPLVLWSISCFDKRREKPFPVYNRLFHLDWASLSETEVAEVLSIIAEPERPTAPSPSTLDAQVVTLSRESRRPDLRMMKFRKNFIEFPDLDNEAFNKEAKNRGRVTFVSLNMEYFEDEMGKPITHYEMIQHVSGQVQPVIVGDSQSILRLGHSTPVLVSEWSAESANTLSQFMNVIERIRASAWFASSKTVSYEIRPSQENNGEGFDKSALLEALFPNDEKTTAVLAYFRQLHARDKLYSKAAETYIKHCGDDRKKWWVRIELESFMSTVDSQPVPFNAPFTRREIIKMFMYGAGLLHATSNDGADKQLAELFKLKGRHNAVVIFNHCLLDIYAAAVPTYHVIWHDYDHWVNELGLTPPERTDIETLFTSFPRQDS
jgi:hypothetical protein